MSEIRGILFDVDGTLYHQEPLRLLLLLRLVAGHLHRPFALPVTVRIIRAYRKAQEEIRRSPAARSDCGARQLERAAELCGERLERVSGCVEEWFVTRPLPFLPYCRRRGMRQVLGALKAQGYRLGVYSDYPAEKKVQALGVREYFQAIVSSQDSEVCGFKPGTNGFAVAASRMGLAPASVLYVGDREDVDGAGAVAAGMTAAILGRKRRGRQTEESLHRIASLRELVMFLKDGSASFPRAGDAGALGAAGLDR